MAASTQGFANSQSAVVWVNRQVTRSCLLSRPVSGTAGGGAEAAGFLLIFDVDEADDWASQLGDQLDGGIGVMPPFSR